MLLGLFTRVQSALLSFRSRLENEDGVIAVEYIIMLVLVALAIVVGAGILGTAINNKLTSAASRVDTCC
jgi:pilus assembly protein Flp/PilA